MEKIACKICGKEFKRICTHVRQAHGISAREYKQAFGYDVKKGLLTGPDREHMRELAYINKMDEQLKKVGTNSRFVKGQKNIGKYVRSAQTMERLHVLNKFTGPKVKKRYKIICQICGGPKYVIPSQKDKAKFCSRKCSTINNNRQRKLSTPKNIDKLI